MCRTRQPKRPDTMMAKRRPRYSAEERKVIAKNKAKKRRDEETKYFTQIDSQVKGESSPFMDLPEKLVHSMALRLANVWKLSYLLLYQEAETPMITVRDEMMKKSIFQDANEHHIMMILHRTHHVEHPGAFVILYVTPSVQQHLHVTNSHELVGAKFEDYCTRDGQYLDLRAPQSQKDKRTYPSVRCRILRDVHVRKGERHEVSFLLLQAPQRTQGSKNKKVESVSSVTAKEFCNYSPQYWRAMQARRLAVRRGAPKTIMVPEHFRRTRVGKESVAALNQDQPTANLKAFAAIQNQTNLAELTKLLSEQPVYEPDPNFLYVNNRNSGMSTPIMSGLQGSGSGVATPVGSIFELNSSGLSVSVSPVLPNPSDTEGNSPNMFIPEPSYSDVMFVQLPETSTFEMNLDNINPTIGLVDTSGDVVDQLSRLSVSDFENMQQVAQDNVTDSKCELDLFNERPCELKTEPEPLSGESIKQEAEDSLADQAVRGSDYKPLKEPNVVFTADVQKEEIETIHMFLVEQNPKGTHYERSRNYDCCSISKGQSAGSLRRTLPSQNLLEMERGSSAEGMELGSSDSLGLSSCGNMKTNSTAPGGIKTSFSSGESFHAPRYIGDSRFNSRQTIDSTSSSSKMVMSENDFEMRGTPQNSVGQDLSDMANSTPMQIFPDENQT